MAFKGITAWILGNKGGGQPSTPSSYNDLENKPLINGVLLEGDSSTEDLGIEIPEVTVKSISVNETPVEPDENGNVDLTIEPGGGALENNLSASIDVGGIDAGDSFEAGTSFESLFNSLLNPTLYPALTAPSLSLSGSGSHLLETGATLAVVLTATFNRGSINPAYGTSGYRSGPAACL